MTVAERTKAGEPPNGAYETALEQLDIVAEHLQLSGIAPQLSQEVEYGAVGGAAAHHIREPKNPRSLEIRLQRGGDVAFAGKLHRPVVRDWKKWSEVFVKQTRLIAVNGGSRGEGNLRHSLNTVERHLRRRGCRRA